MAKYFKVSFCTTLILLILIGCQKETSLTIEVIDFQTEEHIETIKDEKFIRDLVDKLEKAKTVNTEMMDFVLPEYKIIIKDAGEVLYEFGYYQDSLKFGEVEGHYWSQSEDKFYGVKAPLRFKQ